MFQGLLGLYIDQDKSEIYFGEYSEVEYAELVHFIGFRLGSLPVRYLGVTLITRRLSRVACEALRARMVNRIDG